MDNRVTIKWYEYSDKQVHAAFSTKAYSICGVFLIGPEMKFKSLNDFSHYEKCPTCVSGVNKIYKGVL